MAEPAATINDESAVRPETPKKELGPVFKVAAGPTKWLDDRIGIAGLTRPFFRKVFPTTGPSSSVRLRCIHSSFCS